MSSSIAITYTSLLCLLAIEVYVIAYVYVSLSKLSVHVSVTSRKAYKVVSYLVTKCIIEIGYLRVIILSFYVSVSNFLFKVRVEEYEGLIFLLAYRV